MSRVAEAVGVTYLGITKESFDVENDDDFEQVLCWVQDEIQHGKMIHLWASIPYTWSPWQKMALHRYDGYADKLQEKRRRSLDLVSKFHELARLVSLSRGGSSSFEWSIRIQEGWGEPEVQHCMSSLGMKAVQFDGCAFDLFVDGKKPRSQWIVHTTNDRIIKELSSKKCQHEKGFHDPLVGSLTKKSGFYNMNMATCLVSTLFPNVVLDQIPALPVFPFHIDPHRTRLQDFHTPSLTVMATIHRLLSRDEMKRDPKAIETIKIQGAGVREKEVWDDSSVMEKSDRLEQTRRQGRTIHLAEVMAIASINKRRYKGRLVFRGDQIKDSWGGATQFGEMYSTPTNIQSINVAIMYGMMLGNAISTADCARAFLQAFLLLEEEAFGHFKQPTVRLRKALYGHPLASAMWDRHLCRVLLVEMGLIAVEGHPSVFRDTATGLLIVVYVDDVLVAGPSEHHAALWKSLQRHVETDEVESLNKIIGRKHILGNDTCIFDMTDYCQQAVNLHVEAVGGKVSFREVATPYVNESMLTQQDFEVEGQVSNKSSSVLMKL